MTTYVALLRGINVGGHKVKMDELRGHFESMGYKSVSTFIASGNVIFDGGSSKVGKLESAIEEKLLGILGYRVDTFVRSADEVRAAAAQQPFAGGTGTESLFVGFLKGPVGSPQLSALEKLATDRDSFAVSGTELYWQVRGNFLDSLVSGPKIEKALGCSMTVRNMTSLRKLVGTLG